jgi:7-cyano-7-deazaguanine synthase
MLGDIAVSKKAVAIVSGGIDSVTLAHLLTLEGFSMHLLSVDYGQRHLKELEYARLCAERLDANFAVADISGVGRLLKGSALTDDVAVPHGHYAATNMAITVGPNRNVILLSIAYGVAVVESAEVVATGVHAGDHFVYPDCRPKFIEAFDGMQKKAVEGFGNESPRLYAPFGKRTKADIVVAGARLGVRTLC